MRRRVAPLVAAPGPLLVVSDFDGTLAPISWDPGADTSGGAQIVPAARRALRALAGLGHTLDGRVRVAVLSGRSAADVAARVRVGGVVYLGNHGLEKGQLVRRGRADRVSVAILPGFAGHSERAVAVARSVAERLGRPAWLFLEEKGPSVAFHWRGAPDEDAAGRAVDAAVAAAIASGQARGFERLEGRRIIEIRPSNAGAKGEAIRRLLDAENPGAVLVLGDDRSDAEAFAAAAEARATGRVVASLAVAVHGAHETPAEILAAADLMLASPREAARLLSVLATELASTPAT
jgi:trehalose 6-phosphate phosphatase